jgi:sugar-specific transcriptional regulator TrmB
MHQNHILTKIGLTPEQIRIYLALLQLVQGNVSDIAKATGMHRPAIYHHLPALLERGLISRSRNGRRTVFIGESPEHLADVVKRLGEELQEAMPNLLATYRGNETQPVIRYFQGAEGIRSAYEDLLRTIKKGDVVYRYESPQDYKKYGKYKPREYIDRILNKKEVDWLIITNDPQRDRRIPRLERLYKTVPLAADTFTYDISQFIYGKKVSFIDYRHEIASIIESPTFAEFQRKIFKLLFDRL